MTIKRRGFLTASAMALSPLSVALAETSTNKPYSSKPKIGATWSSAARLPLNTQELYPTVHKGRLYVAGGIAATDGNLHFTRRFISFDPTKNIWQDEAELPRELHHAALVSSGDRLFLVGGFHGSETHFWRMRKEVYEYVNGEWKELTSLPKAQAEGVLAYHDGLIHLVTGQSQKGAANAQRSDHIEVDTHLIWQPGSKTWETAAPIPLARNSATGGWVAGELIVTGGRNAKGNFDATHIYDKKEDRWRDARPLPLPQAGTASVVVDDGIIVFGGEIFVPNADVFKEVWRYSLSQDTWSPYPDMINARHGIGAGKIRDKIYVIGGATEPGGKGTSNLNEVLSI